MSAKGNKGDVKKRRDWKPRFLKQLSETLSVTEACSVAHISRKSAYATRKKDQAFASDWDEALAEAIDKAEREMYRRAVDGTAKPVYQSGRHVGDVQEYSDTLLIFMLKSHKPAVYRETTRAETISVDMGQLSDEQIARLAKGESLAAVLAAARPGGAGAPASAEEPAGAPVNA